MRFNSLALMISFAFGILCMMLSTPKPRVVVKFPSPERAGIDVYQTPGGKCYRVTADVVTCPTKGDKVRSQPVTEEEEIEDDAGWFALKK